MHFSLNNDFPQAQLAQVADAAEQVHRRVSQYAVTTLLLETIADLLSPLTWILEKAGFPIYRTFRLTRNPVKQALTGIQPPATFFASSCGPCRRPRRRLGYVAGTRI